MEHAREKGELADILDQGFIEGVFRYLIRAVSATYSIDVPMADSGFFGIQKTAFTLNNGHVLGEN